MTTPTELDGAVVLATARIADLRMLGLRRACARDDGKIPGWLPADVGTFMAQVRPSSCLTLGAASRGCALLLRARGSDSSSSPLAPAGDLPAFPRRAGERHGRGRRAGVTRRAGSCARSG